MSDRQASYYFTPYYRYMWRRNEIMHSQSHSYKVIEHLGSGSFSTVLKCKRWRRDVTPAADPSSVAVKIIDSDRPQLGLKEFRMLARINEANGHHFNCLEVIEMFKHRHFSCIACELLAQSLADYNNFCQREGILMPLSGVKIIMRDILTALDFLWKRNIIHTDLKPENIGLIDPQTQPFRVKLADFGSSLGNEPFVLHRGNNLQTLNYRSPEILLKFHSYGRPIDMWSLGVIFLELYTSHYQLPYRMLYNGLSEYDQMRHIVEGQGMPPRKLLDEGLDTENYFVKTKSRQAWRLMTPEEYLRTPDFRRKMADQLTRDYVITSHQELFEGFGSLALVRKTIGLTGNPLLSEIKRLHHMGELTNRMLDLNPASRITPADALEHPFFS